MLRFWRRRRPAVVLDDPLAIRNLLDQPALRALMIEADDTSDVRPPSPIWTGLASAGPIRLDLVTFPDVAA
jgi:hypothetical protein